METKKPKPAGLQPHHDSIQNRYEMSSKKERQRSCELNLVEQTLPTAAGQEENLRVVKLWEASVNMTRERVFFNHHAKRNPLAEKFI